ncbi:MAG: GDP-mannose 4,6-dehydratase, partial [Cyclobacteriaceae bacterium]
TSPNFDAFNLGTGIGVSVLELVHSFEKANQVKVNYKIGARRPGDVIQVYADPSKIQSAIKWKAKFTLEEAMRHSWVWQQKISAPK